METTLKSLVRIIGSKREQPNSAAFVDDCLVLNSSILNTFSPSLHCLVLKMVGVIGHEYFHNWTGNRVTVRDWFQLTLKEGTVKYGIIRYTPIESG